MFPRVQAAYEKARAVLDLINAGAPRGPILSKTSPIAEERFVRVEFLDRIFQTVV
jgi:hypothetical protein